MNLAQRARASNHQPLFVERRSVAIRSLQRRLGSSTIEEITTRYASGEAIRALSREYSISRDGLRQLLQREGVTLRPQGITLEDAKRAVKLYESGLTIREVVQQVGYSYGTIRKMLHVRGVIVR